MAKYVLRQGVEKKEKEVAIWFLTCGGFMSFFPRALSLSCLLWKLPDVVDSSHNAQYVQALTMSDNSTSIFCVQPRAFSISKTAIEHAGSRVVNDWEFWN